jgi:hypothetical protein
MEVENDVVAPRISKQKECCLGGNHSKTLRSFDGELVLPRTNSSKWICQSHWSENNVRTTVTNLIFVNHLEYVL